MISGETSPGSEPPLRTLSVVLPNFNHGHFLGRALEALARQSHPPDEVVVVDDASTDDSCAVADTYHTRFHSLTLLRNEHNLGVIPALQRGLEAVTGTFVYFASADDFVLPDFFKRAVHTLAGDAEAAFFCGETMLVDSDTGHLLGYRPVVRPSRRLTRFTPSQVSTLLARADNFILTGSTLFRRAMVVSKGGFDPKAGSFADGLLARRLALSHGFYFDPSVLAVWNVSSAGVSRSTALDLDRATSVLTQLPGLINQSAEFPDWYAARFSDRWRFATTRLALSSTPPNVLLLVAMGSKSFSDRWILNTLAGLRPFRIGRLFALAFLALRFRPYRLMDLASTFVTRRMERARGAVRPVKSADRP